MAAGKSSLFSSTDLQFILTLAAGMGAFWISGRLPLLIPAKLLPHNYQAAAVIGIALALVGYGLGMAAWNWLWLGRRSLRPALISALIAMILALAAMLALAFTGAGHTHTTNQMAILAFVLYLAYGAFYVAGWAVARKLSN